MDSRTRKKAAELACLKQRGPLLRASREVGLNQFSVGLKQYQRKANQTPMSYWQVLKILAADHDLVTVTEHVF